MDVLRPLNRTLESKLCTRLTPMAKASPPRRTGTGSTMAKELGRVLEVKVESGLPKYCVSVSSLPCDSPPKNSIRLICERPAGFQYSAVESSATPINAPPIPIARAPTPKSLFTVTSGCARAHNVSRKANAVASKAHCIRFHWRELLATEAIITEPGVNIVFHLPHECKSYRSLQKSSGFG